jgi:chromosome segregation protein
VHFDRLRLVGFKSFVDNTEVAIQEGMTGIVGPNGCGKSNLIEALRWAMGENSSRQMRGNAMDDVIFNGTGLRPARNLAEVSLRLDNAKRQAPAAFNDEPELEVTRRIERGMGSSYRINGREARARDVQLLFADLATGAHATALVSQGRVGALISMKPAERRALLEEAAGITGLHSRRHDAELRLRAAEQNLTRVDDVLQQLEQQLVGLRRQARQASRYRNLSGYIREAEAAMWHLRHGAAEATLAAARAALEGADREVASRTSVAATARTEEAIAAELLPGLRQTEAAAAAGLHRLAVARETLEAEERQALAAVADLEARQAQTAGDRAREEAMARDAAAALARLDAEKTAIQSARADEETAERDAAAAAESTAALVAERQGALDRLTETVAAEDAARLRWRQALADAERDLAVAETRLKALADERRRFEADAGQAIDDEATQSHLAAAREAAEQARGHRRTAEQRRAEAEAAERGLRPQAQAASAEAARMAAEEKGLAKLLAAAEGDLWPPLIDAVTVTSGYEKALGAALGDDLSASADQGAPSHWDALPPLADAPALPVGVRALADFVTAPPALARRLGQIGVVDDADGARLQASLKAGQRLVSSGGALWRWDGFTVRAGAATPAATRLEQRARLTEAREARRQAEARAALAEGALAQAVAARQAAEESDRAARQAADRADGALAAAQDAQSAAAQAAAARTVRGASLAAAAEAATRDLALAQGRREAATAAAAALPESSAARGALPALRQEVEQRRQELADARARLQDLRREAARRAERLGAIEAEHGAWSARAEDAADHLQRLAERAQGIVAELDVARARPQAIVQQKQALAEHLAAAEVARRRAADAMAEAEATLTQKLRVAREADKALAETREERARRVADSEHAAASLRDTAGRILEALSCTPDAVLSQAGIETPPQISELPAVEARVERLKRERDNMGPVNLRADIEAKEVDERATLLQTERADLVAAIERLRQGIGNLNREGRERLLAAFTQVDEEFQKLFIQLFGGGKAHLKLVESEDPLESGLEIMASPPGKRMQVMSLLSGGEKALTALALLFAVFQANPAPICVLDEADAPLDDSNVARFCDLIEGLARTGKTRFLVVTHNPITMARMDRLYGVTMPERGVSSLVSVDLGAAEALRATA